MGFFFSSFKKFAYPSVHFGITLFLSEEAHFTVFPY